MNDLLDRFENHDKRRIPYGKHRFFSDKLKWLVIGLFVVALIFKNRHWPFGGYIMTLSGILAISFMVWQFIEGIRKAHLTKGLFGISLGLCLLYLVFRFQYWPGGAIVLIAALGVQLGTTFYLGTKQQKSEFKPLSMVVIALCIFVFTLENSTIYYYMNLSQGLNRWEHYNSSHAWSKYGDFLRMEGKEKEAGLAYMKSFECASREEDGEIYRELLDEIINE